MSGITGIYAFNQVGSFYMVNFAKAIDCLARRGPDARGYFMDDNIGIGHRRLSIIDPSYVSNQPMHSESKRYVIVFDGEIFNYKELKKELADKGLTFQTESDTEVLLQYFILEKEKCLDRLIGSFAFAIYDKEDKSLFIARDRMGIKPMLFYKDEDKFIFASEMKSLLAYNIPRELDEVSLYQYLQLNYVPKEHSIFKNVYHLLPGEFIYIKGKQLTQKSYNQVSYSEKNINRVISLQESKEKLLELLEDSVRMRLVSDVPIGALLSGDMNTSAIVALASRHTNHLNTFSIGYQDQSSLDELKYTNLAAKKFNANHTAFSLTNQDFHDNIMEVLNYLDEPFADSSALSLYILSKKTSGKVKTVLSGDGANEVFAGYDKYYDEYKIRQGGLKTEVLKTLYPLLDKLPKNKNNFWGNKINQYCHFAEGANMTPKDRYWKWNTIMSEKNITKLFSSAFLSKINGRDYEIRKSNCTNHLSNPGDLNEVLLSDITMTLPNNILFKTDMMSMANGLEVRAPFLDHQLVDFAFSLPIEYKIDNQFKKKLIKDTFTEILPQELYNSQKKSVDPLLKLYKRELRSLILELLDNDFIISQGIFNPKEMQKTKERILSDSYYEQETMWNILMFQYWWKKFLAK